MNALEIRNVEKQFSEFQLDRVSLTLPEGTIMGLIGENGAGKTTLIKLILGMLTKDAGEISVLGQNDIRHMPELKERIGVVLDEVYLPPYMKVQQIGKMMGMLYRQWDSDCFEDLVRKLRIPSGKQFKELSRGNKMKMGIACALSHQAELLLLDEATSGLDPLIRDEILTILLDFTRDEKHSVLMSSHIVSDLDKACDYIAFLHEGRLLLSEEKDRLLEEYGSLVCTHETYSSLPPDAVVGKRETPYGMECIVRTSAVNPSLPIHPVTLEELFIQMVKGGRQ